MTRSVRPAARCAPARSAQGSTPRRPPPKTIDALRQRIASFAIPAPEAGAAYTQAIGTIIATVDAIAELSTDTSSCGDRDLCGGGARQGIRRPGARRGSRGFASGRFSAPDLRGFVALAASQEQQFDVMRRQGSAAQQDALKAALSAAASADVARMREAAITLATGETKDAVAAPVGSRPRPRGSTS